MSAGGRPAAAFELSESDHAQLREHGVRPEEVLREVGLAQGQPFPFTLVRPCTLGDGIESLAPGVSGVAVAAARAAGRFSAFVPAAGAATRMFEALLAYDPKAPEPNPIAKAAVFAFADGLPRFAFTGALRSVLAARGLSLEDLLSQGRCSEVLAALLERDGLGFGELPKGLLPFHMGSDGPRTALEEVLLEEAPLLRDGAGRARVHVVVSPAHLERFRAFVRTCLPRCEGLSAVRYLLELSVQKPGTDNLALLPDGRPLRDASGRLILRPSGHGALLENLEECGGDLVFIRNVDNVAVDRLKEEGRRWKNALAALMLELQAAVHRALEGLEAGGDPGDAQELAAGRLGLELPRGWQALDATARRAWLIEALDRPLRVCGVVQNQGEPGGAPFWVRDRSGRLSRQLVERGQVDFRSGEQRDVFHCATHFNPVNLLCALKDRRGRAYPLARLVDPEAVIVTRKSNGGREVVAVERPGLWNGGMSGWNTVFAEVPISTFHPVKSVNDLLREGHQA